MGAPGLGNFAGQLSADELRRALAAAGGNPDELDFGETALPTQQPQAPPPVAAEPPPAEAAALDPLAPTERPPDMSVQRARGGPAKAIDTYQGEQLDNANARIANMAEMGDAQGIDAKGHEERAGIRQRQAEQAKAGVGEAKQRVDERRAHEQRFQAEADRLYEEMRVHSQPPPQSTMNKVLGIVGAVASMGGKNGVAQGVGMLSSMLGSDTERWAAEHAANSNLYKSALAAVSSDRDGEVHELEVAQRLAVLEAHEIDASLEASKEVAQSRTTRAAIEEMQRGFRDNVLKGLESSERQKLNAMAKARSANAEDPLWRMPLDALKQLNAGGGLSEAGQKVLAQRIANDQKDRGGEADIGKKLADGGEGGVQRGVGGGAVIPGLKLNKPMGDVTPKEYDEAQKITDGVAALESALTSMEKTQGSFDTDDKAEYERSFALAVGGLNTLANAGVLNPGELKAWEKRLPAHVISNVTTINPMQKLRSALGDEEKQLGDLRKQLKNIAATKLKSRGYAFDAGMEAATEDPFAAFGGKMSPGAAAAPEPATRRAPAPSRGGPGFEGMQPEVAQTVRDAEDFLRRSGSGPGGGV